MVREDGRGDPPSYSIRYGATTLTLQGIFSEQVVQGGATHPQFIRRAGNVATMLGEGTLNEVFLKGFMSLAKPFALGQILAVRGVQIEIGWGSWGPCVSSSARLTRFSSSRTFPGQL
jgi:hypothetical protein